jgi:hypothetical protein
MSFALGREYRYDIATIRKIIVAIAHVIRRRSFD